MAKKMFIETKLELQTIYKGARGKTINLYKFVSFLFYFKIFVKLI